MKAITRDIYIADEIRYKIEIGEFKPHDKLPSERQFCEYLIVSVQLCAWP